jgi:hypothetical protein
VVAKRSNRAALVEARHLRLVRHPLSVNSRRDRAILPVLLGGGLLIGLTLDHIQRREDHWAIVDRWGKEGISAEWRCRIG